MAQNYKDVLASKYGTDLVVGPDGYNKLPELINVYKQTRLPQVCLAFSQENYEGIIPQPDNQVTGFISIMRGCNNYCSYCIVPYVRGEERSKSMNQIIKEVENLVSNDIKDITLVGQNVLAWKEADLDFLDLLKTVDNISDYDRLRFITSHPKDITKAHFEVFVSLKKFCPHIHLPLQSGSNRILKLMNRRYTKEEYIEKVELARKIIPDVSLTTDVMVGFPTESDEDCIETLDVIKKLRFDFAYMFKYSERLNTKACDILPKVDSKISQQRLLKLIELQNKITKQKSQELLHKNIEVLIESKNGKQSFARSRTNKQVIIKEPVILGKTYQCKITNVVGWTPIGEIETKTNKQQSIVNNKQPILKEVM
jgi:tRNA-2-methylthio-N6-dimethylallyladenosine synthase